MGARKLTRNPLWDLLRYAGWVLVLSSTLALCVGLRTMQDESAVYQTGKAAQPVA